MKTLAPFGLLCGLIVDTLAQTSIDQLDWLVGTWKADFQGKTRWPTIPTMTFGEIVTIQRAPVARATGVQMLNFTAVSWAHSTKDHLHDEWGYLGVDHNGYATLMTSGNNGFNKFERGPVRHGFLELRLEDIGRVHFTRDLPVLDVGALPPVLGVFLRKKMRRTFRPWGNGLEQVIEMRTETHPAHVGALREHSRVTYKKM